MSCRQRLAAATKVLRTLVIPETAAATVFTRFWRYDDSHSSSEGRYHRMPSICSTKRKCRVVIYSSNTLSQRSASFRSRVKAMRRRQRQLAVHMSDDASTILSRPPKCYSVQIAPLGGCSSAKISSEPQTCLATAHGD